jgi:hypothetical protein
LKQFFNEEGKVKWQEDDIISRSMYKKLFFNHWIKIFHSRNFSIFIVPELRTKNFQTSSCNAYILPFEFFNSERRSLATVRTSDTSVSENPRIRERAPSSKHKRLCRIRPEAQSGVREQAKNLRSTASDCATD